ncbi:MAG: MBL fold metallo-hydrolase, partial [Acidobacteria bacterium]|nr:MBL fold metallo-hydrolase [Acidobacteriota bacterium]
MRRVSRQAVWFTAVTLVVLGAGALHSYVAQSRFDEVKIEAEKVADGIYMLKGAGGNMGVSVGADGVLLIDDQFSEVAGGIRAASGERGGGAPTFLLNTHYHGDHTGGNAEFSATTPILAHDNVRARLVSGHQAMGGESKPSPPEALPVITYSQGVTLHFNGEEIQLRHFPAGHT